MSSFGKLNWRSDFFMALIKDHDLRRDSTLGPSIQAVKVLFGKVFLSRFIGDFFPGQSGGLSQRKHHGQDEGCEKKAKEQREHGIVAHNFPFHVQIHMRRTGSILLPLKNQPPSPSAGFLRLGAPSPRDWKAPRASCPFCLLDPESPWSG